MSTWDLPDKAKRGTVWCYTCGKKEFVNAFFCMDYGWPKCCGVTMSLDSPEERAEMEAKARKEAQP